MISRPSLLAKARPPGRIICVLGMHRSGTSCLTGSLQEAGLYLGDCHTWNPYNLKGNRENQDIVDLNDAVLADSGAAWDRPPARVVWSEANRKRALELVAAHGGRPFGFKDPRTLLVLDGWLQLFPAMEFIGIFRHPAQVADSLRRRSEELSTEFGLELWYQYNKRLLQYYRQRPFPLLCFDDEAPLFQRKLRRVLDRLDLPGDEWRGDFYDAGLKSAAGVAQARLPWRTRRLYRKLTRLAE